MLKMVKAWGEKMERTLVFGPPPRKFYDCWQCGTIIFAWLHALQQLSDCKSFLESLWNFIKAGILCRRGFITTPHTRHWRRGELGKLIIIKIRIASIIGLPYVRFFPDMPGILVAKYASGRNVKQCFIVRDFGIMHFMKSNRNVFTIRII